MQHVPTVWNATLLAQIVMRCFLCLIGTDIVAREKIMKVTGNRSYSYCMSCKVQEIHNGIAMYCLLHRPTDKPRQEKKAARKKKRWPCLDYEVDALPLREVTSFRKIAADIQRLGASDKLKSKHGIKGLSIFAQLPSIDFPRSFQPDSMHLFCEQILPTMFRHFRGKFFTDAANIDGDGQDLVVDTSVSGQRAENKGGLYYKSSDADDELEDVIVVGGPVAPEKKTPKFKVKVPKFKKTK